MVLESSDSEDHFSDAQTGLQDQSGLNSPIPVTRVEKVVNEPSHGEVPGTDAYNVRAVDAAPDEIAMISAGEEETDQIAPGFGQSAEPPIPTTLEKVDPSSESHGEVPRANAHAMNKADATPGVILKVPENGSNHQSNSSLSEDASTPSEPPFPKTEIKENSGHSSDDTTDMDAVEAQSVDIKPDVVDQGEDVQDVQGR